MNKSKKTIIAGIAVCAVSASVSASPVTAVNLESLTQPDIMCNELQAENSDLICSFIADDNTKVVYEKHKKRHVDNINWLDWLLNGDDASEAQDKNFG
jgi:ethanolamine ammonia-lyase large subunit|tara:strand:- start:12523 stop:12816 length:294 start_codon:yes stop_codon:yes gene_type:complete